ncbi:unnamed protein product [Cuscuta campestris]|uniref:Retrotransposon gag domain-containing protein n=1 Tax=Cuscuta campestris TaxID=132261 RepID=A0A484KK91_9ASTE|nr:unnamed protein product [Cuscuta campestris]
MKSERGRCCIYMAGRKASNPSRPDPKHPKLDALRVPSIRCLPRVFRDAQSLPSVQGEASNPQSVQALQAQVDYLAKQIPKLTKQKLAMLQSSDDGEEASSSATVRTRAQDKSSSDFKVDIPIFEGKNDLDEFPEWQETVERVFDFKEVSDEKKVKIVALKFRKYASTWWSNIKTKRNRDEKPPVDTSQKMKTLLKKKFLPTEYVRENFARLQTLRQGSKSVEDYTREFEELLLSHHYWRCTNKEAIPYEEHVRIIAAYENEHDGNYKDVFIEEPTSKSQEDSILIDGNFFEKDVMEEATLGDCCTRDPGSYRVANLEKDLRRKWTMELKG